MKKRLVQFLLILSQAMFLFCEDSLCEAMNALYSLGATAYTDEVVWKQGRSSVLIEDENEKSKYEWNKLQDKDTATCWSEGKSGNGFNEYVLIPFGRSDGANFSYRKAKKNKNIKCCLEINNGNCKSADSFSKYNRVKKCKIKVFDIPANVGQNSTYTEAPPLVIYDSEIVLQDNPELQKFDFTINLRDDYLYSSPSVVLQLIILDVYPGTDNDNTCISEINIYGEYVNDSEN